MKERSDAPVPAQLLAAFVDGEVTPSEARRIEAALANSAATRTQLAALRRVRDALSQPVAELEATDLVAGLRERIDREARPLPRRVSRAWTAVASAAALAAASAVVVSHRSDWGSAPTSQRDDGFRAKSGQQGEDERARWAAIHAYAVVTGKEPQALGQRIPSRAGLLFSYTNLGSEPFEYLMVYAVDARGEIRWCYPAYLEAGTDPTAIPIQKRVARAPLPELIHLDLAPGPATLYALFSRQPLRVLEVEAWLREDGAERVRQGAPDTLQRELKFEVER